MSEDAIKNISKVQKQYEWKQSSRSLKAYNIKHLSDLCITLLYTNLSMPSPAPQASSCLSKRLWTGKGTAYPLIPPAPYCDLNEIRHRHKGVPQSLLVKPYTFPARVTPCYTLALHPIYDLHPMWVADVAAPGPAPATFFNKWWRGTSNPRLHTYHSVCIAVCKFIIRHTYPDIK
jgi:hypothetical protein